MHPSTAHQYILEALNGYDQFEAQSISRIILRDIFQTDHRQSRPLSGEQTKELESICHRLRAQEPIQYIIGWADFFGLRFRVNPHVLIPRMETEVLVDTCLTKLKVFKIDNPEILDIGTGSGCIAVSLAKKHPSARVIAIDSSSDALLVAEANAELNHVHVGFVLHDVLKPGNLPVKGFDLIVSNPPYIPEKEKSLMHANVLTYEPQLALFVSDSDPLVFYKRIAEHASHHLYAGGILAFECNEFNASQVADLLRTQGWHQVELIQDLSGADRVVVGIQPG